MKRILLSLFLLATIALVLFLFKPPASNPIVFEQMSEMAIFNLKGQEQIDAFFEQGFKVVSPHPNPQTLVKISGNHGPIAISKLTIESPGEVFISNNGGVIVGETADLDWDTSENQTEFLTTENGEVQVGLNRSAQQAEVIHKGNVYALAINKEGAIRATDSKPKRSNIFEYPNDEGKLLFSDE